MTWIRGKHVVYYLGCWLEHWSFVSECLGLSPGCSSCLQLSAGQICRRHRWQLRSLGFFPSRGRLEWGSGVLALVPWLLQELRRELAVGDPCLWSFASQRHLQICEYHSKNCSKNHIISKSVAKCTVSCLYCWNIGREHRFTRTLSSQDMGTFSKSSILSIQSVLGLMFLSLLLVTL